MESNKSTNDKLGSITINVGKPNKDGRRGVSCEWTVKRTTEDTDEDYNKRYNYFKTKALSEL